VNVIRIYTADVASPDGRGFGGKPNSYPRMRPSNPDVPSSPFSTALHARFRLFLSWSRRENIKGTKDGSLSHEPRR
ncbi:hypothetical protein, partial [Microvirga massiliensis]|uniref:hypothetical protein n=1 Tax=Microvirga massiliensis TaxID=1033741 RepID=UPI000AFE6077